MYQLILFFSIVLIITSCNKETKIKVINVFDFCIEANTKQNVVTQINKLIENLKDGPVEIVFPNGRYDFYPDSGYLKSYFETNTYDVNPNMPKIELLKE